MSYRTPTLLLRALHYFQPPIPWYLIFTLQALNSLRWVFRTHSHVCFLPLKVTLISIETMSGPLELEILFTAEVLQDRRRLQVYPAEDDDTAIIIDFGSCRLIGDSIGDIGRTLEWYDDKVLKSIPSNDTDALEEIAEWLRNGKNFKFEMWC